MNAQLLDGKMVADKILAGLREQVRALKTPPCVAFIRVGEHPASATYVKKKQETAASIGITSRVELLPEHTTQEQLIAVIQRLAGDATVHGILVQSPLPAHINAREVFNAVPSHKDIDGFSAANLGRLSQGDDSAMVACTPLGIKTLLDFYKIPTTGKHVVVVGRSLIVGRPLSLLLNAPEGANATVTSCNKETENLEKICKTADILIVAAGCPGLVKAGWVKRGAVVIDVGITRIPDAGKKAGYRLVGDVDFKAVVKKASYITPVPGGVGPMTVAMLMSNTVKAARLEAFVEQRETKTASANRKQAMAK